MAELKSCPFCGGEAKVQRFPHNYSVYCTECGSRTMLFKPTEKEAIEVWNRRVNDVRPVVYCKDCIHRPYSTEPKKTSGFAVESPDRECKCPCFNPDDGYYSWIPADDFFCADGERCGKEDAE